MLGLADDGVSSYYLSWLGGLLVLTAGLSLAKGSSGSASTDKPPHTPEYLSFRRLFLAAYLLAMLSDWLQGPYVYKLYKDLGFGKDKIAVLFIAGFGSSMIFGTFVGALADKYGRRLNALLFCIIYGACCLTKHSGDFRVLMLGRLLGGWVWFGYSFPLHANLRPPPAHTPPHPLTHPSRAHTLELPSLPKTFQHVYFDPLLRI